MSKVAQLFESEVIKQRDVTPVAVHRVLRAAGFEVELKDDGVVTIEAPGPQIILTVAEDPVFKIFYSAYKSFRPGLSQQKRLALSNSINKHIIGAAYVEEDSLRVACTLPFEGGMLPRNLASAIREFGELFDAFLEQEGAEEFTI